MATVLLDCDGVLLEWDRSFARWCKTHHGIEPCPTGPKDWSLGEWLGVHSDRAFELVEEFNHSPDFAHIWPCQNALKGVRELVDGGHRLDVITSCSENVDAQQRRSENLTRCFGDAFTNVICLPLGFSKSNVLSAYDRRCIWVEDNYANAEAGCSAGHHTFMINRSHNQKQRNGSDPRIRWVSAWDDIVSLARRITF